MKKIDDMNDFEVLCVGSEADSNEIYMAYVRAKNALKPDSLASYALMPDDEKEKLRIRIEMAYHNLGTDEGNNNYEKGQDEEADTSQQSVFGSGKAGLTIKEKDTRSEKIRNKVKLAGKRENPSAKAQSAEAQAKSGTEGRSLLMRIEKLIFIIILIVGMLLLFGFVISLIPDKNFEVKIQLGEETAKTKRFPIIRRMSDHQKKDTNFTKVAGEKEANFGNPAPQEKVDDAGMLQEGGVAGTGLTENPLNAESAFYVVGKDESLSGIAAKDSVYGSAFKWTILYRLNVNKLKNTVPNENLPDAKLEQGLKLALVTTRQFNEMLKYRSKDDRVVNILSAKEYGKIVELATLLIEKGYPVYITSARIRGEVWMRLRVGFFKSKSNAEEKGKEIIKLIESVDFWCTRPSQKELMDFGGY